MRHMCVCLCRSIRLLSTSMGVLSVFTGSIMLQQPLRQQHQQRRESKILFSVRRFAVFPAGPNPRLRPPSAFTLLVQISLLLLQTNFPHQRYLNVNRCSGARQSSVELLEAVQKIRAKLNGASAQLM